MLIDVCAMSAPGITPSGLGKVIEAYHRTVPTDAVLGGGKSFAYNLVGDL